MTRADGQQVRLSPSDWLGIVGLVLSVLVPLIVLISTMRIELAVLQSDMQHVVADVADIKTHVGTVP